MQFNELSKEVYERLGIRMDENDRGSMKHLNEMPPELVENARRLKEIWLVMPYLEFYAQEEPHFLQWFMQAVVFGGADPRTWMKGAVLVPSVSLADQLTKTKEMLFGDLLNGDVTMIPQNYEDWSQNGSAAGGFAFARPDTDYRSVPPEGFSFFAPQPLETVDREKIPVLFRRWIASRIAMVMRDKLQQLPDVSPLEQFAKPDLWTEDAWKAIKGLTLEKEQGLCGPNKVPGYCGPDAFYA